MNFFTGHIPGGQIQRESAHIQFNPFTRNSITSKVLFDDRSICQSRTLDLKVIYEVTKCRVRAFLGSIFFSVSTLFFTTKKTRMCSEIVKEAKTFVLYEKKCPEGLHIKAITQWVVGLSFNIKNSSYSTSFSFISELTAGILSLENEIKMILH